MHGLCFDSRETLVRILQNNPRLESLILRFIVPLTFFDMMVFVAENLKHLKELALITNCLFPAVSRYTIDSFVASLRHVESLALTISNTSTRLFQRLSVSCMNIKHLEFKVPDDERLGHALIDALSSLENIESFALEQHKYNDEVELMLEKLPKLRHLHVKIRKSTSHTIILVWLHKCPLLERITIADRHSFGDQHAAFPVNLKFFAEFRDATQNRHVRVEFQENTQIIGYISRDEIVWRNKLVYWFGWDPTYNLTNLNLLDLAKQQSNTVKASNQNLIVLILEYLDLDSLHSFSAINHQIGQLVKNYVQERAQQQAPFIISNEFNHYNGTKTLEKYVNQLNVYNFDECRYSTFQIWIRNHYPNVQKLRICKTPNFFSWVFPQIRHFICNSFGYDAYWALYKICNNCPHLEILECKSQFKFEHSMRIQCSPIEFYNLKKFIFKYSDDAQVEIIKEIFKNTNTALIPIM